MAENKVVIKVSLDKGKSRKVNTEPQMITIWHTRRIITALAILLLIICLSVFWLVGNDIPAENQERRSEVLEAPRPDDTQQTAVGTADIQADAERMAVNGRSRGSDNSAAVHSAKNRPAAIIFDRKVIRASLNAALKDNEPGEPVKLPVKIAGNRSVELFYFNEIKSSKDKPLFHHWLKDGKLIQKKPLNIKDSRAKVASSRVFAAKDKGEWQIQLVDGKGKVYSEVSFSVTAE